MKYTSFAKKWPRGLTLREFENYMQGKIDANLFEVMKQSLELAYQRGRMAEHVDSVLPLDGSILKSKPGDNDSE